MRQVGVLVAAVTLATGAAGAPPKNVLFYGNSFTLGYGGSRSVNALFREVAVAAGHEAPLVQSAAAPSQTIGWHLRYNGAAIVTLIPPDRDWDAIVMQEHSTRLTRVYADSPPYPHSVERSKVDVVGLYRLAAKRSPGVKPVLFQTWARGPGHPFFTGADPPYPDGPSEMQAEVRVGYDALRRALDAAGAPTACVARVGDAWEAANYDRLHSGDDWHAANRGTLLAALVVYGAVYGDATTSDLDLSGVLASLNLTAADGESLTAAADAVLAP